MPDIEIPLTKGLVTIIDSEDLALVADYKWCATVRTKTYYAITKLPGSEGKLCTMHRLLANAKPGQLVDHKDRHGWNNRRNNLRVCTKSQNGANAALRKDNTSGYRGVTWHSLTNKWQAKIKVGPNSTYLGLFTDPWEAAQAYNEAAITAWGEFSLINERILR
jgi:hypothetical protein